MKEQEIRVQETLNLCKLFLENIDNASLAKSENSAMNQKFNVKNSKKTLPESSVRSKYSSKSSKPSSSSTNTSVKSNESLFKLLQDTERAKMFANQIEKQAKRKLELIKRGQGIEEAETLNAVVEDKEKYNTTAINEPQTTNSISQNLRPSTSYFIPKSSNVEMQRNNI